MARARHNGISHKAGATHRSKHPKVDLNNLLFRIDITMAADIKAISPLVDSVLSLVHQVHCAHDKEFEVETALREALANAVVHGCANDCNKHVQCSIACDRSNGILIVVRDPGAGFNPGSVPKPTKSENLYSTHGRGIYLIHELMDDVHFKRGGREIHMTKH